MKKILFSCLFVCSVLGRLYSQNIFPTAAGTNAGIGTTSPSSYSGYSGLTTNNATNGGIIDFKQNGSPRGWVTGDANGMTLFAPGGFGLHLWANATEDLTIIPNNSIGMGTITPRARLEIAPPIPSQPAAIIRASGGQAWGHLLTLETDNAAGQDDPAILFSYRNGAKQWAVGGQNGSLPGYVARFSIWEDATDGVYGTTNTVTNGYGVGNGYGFERFTVLPGGNVGIGKINPTNKLDVNGTIHSKAVLVDQTGWSDYVFLKNYSLPSLNAVKSYINVNHHLQGVPSEVNVLKNGQDLGEMNQILLKKVEELTLYLIKSDDHAKILDEKLKKQSNIIQEQEKRLVKLEQNKPKLLKNNKR